MMNFWKKISKYPRLGLVLLAYAAFIALGMPDGLLGVAWPSIRVSFGIPLDAAGILMTTSVAGYLTSSFLSGRLIAKLGVGRVLALSCLLTGMTLLGYTLVPVWWMMASLGVVAGLGAGAIDAGLNSYVAANFGEGLMQWLHASYGVGITLGPMIMTFGLATFQTWRAGYRIVAGFQLAMALCFALTLAMWQQDHLTGEKAEQPASKPADAPLRDTLARLPVWMSMFLFFLYVGIEGSIGTWTYSLLTESRGIEPTVAGVLTGSFWATFTIGRVLAGIFAKQVGLNRMVQGGVGLALAGELLLIWNPSRVVSLAAVALIGIAIAPIYPALMSGTQVRVGERFATNTIGMQVASAGLGMAVLPGLMGVLANRFSMEVVPVCVTALLVTLFILYRLSIPTENRNLTVNAEKSVE
jgi:fucose permease